MPMKSRAVVRYTMTNPVAYGARRLHAMALDALRRAGVGAWFDPIILPTALGREARHVTGMREAAVLDGRCIDIRFEPGDRRATGFNAFFGSALAIFQDIGENEPGMLALALLAGFLGLPDTGIAPDVELALQCYLPIEFMREHQRRRRWASSGVYAASR